MSLIIATQKRKEEKKKEEEEIRPVTSPKNVNSPRSEFILSSESLLSFELWGQILNGTKFFYERHILEWKDKEGTYIGNIWLKIP